MGNQYYPSNGSEGSSFMDEFCDNCYKCDGCSILLKVLIGERVKQWIYDDNANPVCTSFSAKRPVKGKKVDTNQTNIFDD